MADIAASHCCGRRGEVEDEDGAASATDDVA